MTVALALVLASHTVLRHHMLDMATHYDSQWDVTTELRVDGAGAATFHIVGSVTSQGVELTPGAAGARTVMASHVTRVDDTWSGHATTSSASVVVHFDSGAGFPGGVDVEWRCDRSAVVVSSISTPVWKCSTPQSMTRRTGAAQALPEYMRIPTYLAAPTVALKVDQAARGGADYRSNETSLRLSR